MLNISMVNSTYNCKNCGAESKRTRQKFNIFCSNACSGEAKFKETLVRFNEGLIAERPTIRKVLSAVRGYHCEICKISDYNNKPITLQVDHIDANAGNNSPKNLRLLCPNCHSQTSSFGGGNKGFGRKARNLSSR